MTSREEEGSQSLYLLSEPQWRSTLLEIILSSDESFTAEKMSLRLGEEGYAIGRAAVTVFMRRLAREKIVKEEKMAKRGGQLLIFTRATTLHDYWLCHRRMLLNLVDEGDKKYLEKEAAEG